MKTFIQWAEVVKKELPLYMQDENTKRAGIAHWAYPDAYVRSQYPDGVFMPYAADAMFKMGIGAGKKHEPSRKAPADAAW
jgi:hypothetical protein